jgi:hypothetical protein
MRELLPFLILFAATFVQVFLRVFQQLNVIHRDYWLMPLGSYGMAYAELLIVLMGAISVAKGRSWIITGFAIGTGGWMGSWACMALYDLP